MVRLVADNGPSQAQAEQRRRLLAGVHIARKKLDLVEDDYRALLQRVTGEVSAAQCDNAQLGKVMAEFERMGFRSYARGQRRPAASSAIARKARALWIGLHALGTIDDCSEKALEAFGRRQLGVDRLHWADQSQAAPLIEALKAMAEREGWDQTVPARLPAAERGRLLSERLVQLLIKRLAEYGESLGAVHQASCSADDLHGAARELGARLREAKSRR